MKRFLIGVRQSGGLVFYQVRGEDKGHAARSLYEWLKGQEVIELPPIVSTVELREDLSWPQRVAYVAQDIAALLDAGEEEV